MQRVFIQYAPQQRRYVEGREEKKRDVYVKSQFSPHSYSIVHNNVCIELYQSQIQ